jgi:hypothetical protein
MELLMPLPFVARGLLHLFIFFLLLATTLVEES